MVVIGLAGMRVKPDANHANAYPPDKQEKATQTVLEQAKLPAAIGRVNVIVRQNPNFDPNAIRPV